MIKSSHQRNNNKKKLDSQIDMKLMKKTRTILKKTTSIQNCQNNQNLNQLTIYREQKGNIDQKIDQLHVKMKDFFNVERKKHNQTISIALEELIRSISELQNQLNKPKSTVQVQQQKHELMIRKSVILQQIQQINKQLKINKQNYSVIKMENQQLDREIVNSERTIEKYDKKIELNGDFKGDILQINKNNQKNQRVMTQSQQNLNESNIIVSNENEGQLKQKKKKSKLPSIVYHKNNYPSSKNHMQSNKYSIFTTAITSSRHKKTEQNQPSLLCPKEKQQKSTTIFQSYLKDQQINKIEQRHKKIKKNFLNSLTNKTYEIDLVREKKKYEAIVTKEKYQQVQSIFKEMENYDMERQKQGGRNNPFRNLQDLLIEELRKKEYARYEQKGYHEGLKVKTHQIKLRLKNIFKNYSTEEFFNEIMKKKTVKKELNSILQDGVM